MTNIFDSLQAQSQVSKPVEVQLSLALVRLLSEQLYQSPMKAIEELVINAYDANAKECKIFVPPPSDVDNDYIVIFDNGHGMNYEGLTDLWQIGHSNKRDEEIEKRSHRKQIGKFGIGKLATYTIAEQLTYLTKTDKGILGLTIDFTEFDQLDSMSINSSIEALAPLGSFLPEKTRADAESSTVRRITLPVYQISDWVKYEEENKLSTIYEALSLDIDLETCPSWTFAILEKLKPQRTKLTQGRLEWVLRTAMPLSSDFQIFLNGTKITSSKQDFEKVVKFSIADLPEKRIDDLASTTGQIWKKNQDRLIADMFPSGISGFVIVTENVLYGGKSDDLERSHGFFVKVRDRLIDAGDPLFGMNPLRYGTFNRLRVEIRSDDLDEYIKASRDALAETEQIKVFRSLLRAIFNEADSKYLEYIESKDKPKGDNEKREGHLKLVAPKLVEYPVADALVAHRFDSLGTEADESWFYIQLEKNSDIQQVIQQLYNQPRSKYRYEYTDRGKTDRLAKFDPATSIFSVNESHELVIEYSDNPRSRRLLEDFITAEMALEAYLRETGIPPHLIGDILQRRDNLLRALVNDHPYSPSQIGKRLRDSADKEHELEINMVIAARALGFTASQISGTGQPDGIARYRDYPNGERKIILEAKSSGKEKIRANALGLADIKKHMRDMNAHGCLLVAVGYQGSSKEDSNVSQNAIDNKISCWTVEQLAQVVEQTELRQISASDIIQIVETYFAPSDVEKAVNALLLDPSYSSRDLYQAVMQAITKMSESGQNDVRDVSMVFGAIMIDGNFKGISREQVKSAIADLAGASKGTLRLSSDEKIVLLGELDEIKNRVSNLTNQSGQPRSLSNFRE